MEAGEYVGGLALLCAVIGPTVAATVLIVRRRLGHLAGSALPLAYGLVFTAAWIGVHLLPTALGVLSRATPIVAAALLLLVAWRVPQARAADPAPPPEPGTPSGHGSWAVAALGVAALAVGLLAWVLPLADVAPTGIDALNFHLPGAISWIHSGSIWQIDQFVPYLAHGNYPNNGDVVLLSAVLPWHDDFLLRVVFLPWAAFMGLGIYALARELRAPRATAMLAAAACVALPTVLVDLVESTLPDVVMFSTFAAGLTFLLRHHRTGARSDLVLAGLGLGLAFGTKWFGVSSVIAVVAVWAILLLAERRGLRRLAIDGGVLVGVIAAAGGIWFVRNLVLSGNPVFPVDVSPLGVAIFDAPRDFIRERAGFSIAHYAGDGAIFADYFVPAWRRSLGLGGAVIAAGVLAAALLAALEIRRPRYRRRSQPRRVLAAAATVALLAAVYAVTPYSAFGPEGDPLLTFVNVRYGVPTLLLGAAVAAAAAVRLGRARLLLELGLLAAVGDGLRRAAHVDAADAVVAAVVVGAAVAAAVGVRFLARRRPSLVAPAAAAMGLAALAVGVFEYRQQDLLDAARYRGIDPAFDYVIDRAPRDHAIGLAGVWSNETVSPVTPMFGPDLDNEVSYVGPFVDELLREYREPTEFRAALERGGYELVLVGRGAPPKRRVRYDGWLEAAGWERVTASRYLELYRRRDDALLPDGGS